MAFVKVGDENPIVNYFDDNGKEQFCPTCGKKLVLIAVASEENTFVCADCDIDKTEKPLKN